MATLHLWGILSESKRIINAHSRHFLALSVIFLLPLSFSLIVSPTLFRLVSLAPNPSNIHILLRTPFSTPFPHPHHHHHNTPVNPAILLSSLYLSLLLVLISLLALSSITHSVFHGFFGRPVKLPSAIKSILPSFLPLLLTTLLSQLILLIIISLFALLSYFLVQLIYHLTPTLPPSSPLFLFVFALTLLPLFIIILHLRVSWTLASVIAVLESSYGFVPLKRSAVLMRGMRGVGLSSLLFFGFMEGALVWCGSVLAVGPYGTHISLLKDWALVVQIVVASTLLMLLLLYHTATNTVLYMYCKAIHGELAVDIMEEFAMEYVSLPFDEGKVPHVVSVVHV